MMSFTPSEILLSVIYALIYGALSALVLSVIILIKGMLARTADIYSEMMCEGKIFPLPRFKGLKIEAEIGPILSVLAIFFFALGFSLLSYLSLDGELRIYMLILAFASFYLSKCAFFEFFTKVFLYFFRLFLTVISFIFRLAGLPIGWVVKQIKILMRKVNARK